MKLEFLHVPTRDLPAALALYRDELGWEEAWREGELAVSLKLPGTDVQLMLVAEEPDGGTAFGPIFVIDDAKRFFAERPAALRANAEPQEIPGGFLATFQDPSGNTIYVMDQSTEAG
jgi:catechol 2,3-dioxygenase-like lactoylglutathione lyase family enzyme